MGNSDTVGQYFLSQGRIMNGEKYAELLKEKLAIHMHIHKCTIFMHDSATCQRSKKVKNYLMTAKATRLELLGNRHDLNPMENLWKILKRKIADKQPSSASTLIDAIKSLWIKEVSVDYCQKPIPSMPLHIQNKERLTKYYGIFNKINVLVVFYAEQNLNRIRGWS